MPELLRRVIPDENRDRAPQGIHRKARSRDAPEASSMSARLKSTMARRHLISVGRARIGGDRPRGSCLRHAEGQRRPRFLSRTLCDDERPAEPRGVPAVLRQRFHGRVDERPERAPQSKPHHGDASARERASSMTRSTSSTSANDSTECDRTRQNGIGKSQQQGGRP